MRRSLRERLIEDARGAQQTRALDLDGLMRLLLNGEPNPTQRAFIMDPARLKAYKGPAGCAKTSTICAAILLRALLQPGFKGLVARYDYNDLMDTTALRLEEMVGRLPKGTLLDRDKSPPMKWWIRSAVPGADATPSQITFMGLKEMMGSYEFNAAIVDEADEVDEKRIHEINTRLRNAGEGYAVMLAFNPPDKHHWLYTACTGKSFQDKQIANPWLKLFEPQPRENVANLPADYYDVIARSLPEDMRQRLIQGLWGSTFEGQPVYREFVPRVHVFDELAFDAGSRMPLMRWWDFGYAHPACIWAQVDDTDGGVNILHETLGETEEVGAFARRILAETAGRFPNARRVVDYGDPAVKQQKDTGQTLQHLHKAGITMLYRTQKIDPGVRQIRTMLEQMSRGRPMLRFKRTGVPILIAAMRGGYRLDPSGQKPVKDGYYDHLADAFRYGITNTYSATGALTVADGDEVNVHPMFEQGDIGESLEYNPAYDPVVQDAYD